MTLNEIRDTLNGIRVTVILASAYVASMFFTQAVRHLTGQSTSKSHAGDGLAAAIVFLCGGVTLSCFSGVAFVAGGPSALTLVSATAATIMSFFGLYYAIAARREALGAPPIALGVWFVVGAMVSSTATILIYRSMLAWR
jgi:hypothetical protein